MSDAVERGRGRERPSRPDTVFDRGVQHERTALAWERTAIAAMVAGAVLARYASTHDHVALGVLGVAWVVFGGGVLFWSGWHYEDLHGPLREGRSPTHVTASRVMGVATVAFVGVALVLAVYLAVIDR
jgi:putative membrane protein